MLQHFLLMQKPPTYLIRENIHIKIGTFHIYVYVTGEKVYICIETGIFEVFGK